MTIKKEKLIRRTPSKTVLSPAKRISSLFEKVSLISLYSGDMMATSKSKEKILEDSGYRYHFMRMIYAKNILN